ncbi:hypothetical protein LCGC14_1092010 [marine sediment metagenome]|uniref:Uncharacterized protein n=1 Tax=marine sediment metagenome TaxID=412755 RepID=A0A0F9MZT3_9ZZZZ
MRISKKKTSMFVTRDKRRCNGGSPEYEVWTQKPTQDNNGMWDISDGVSFMEYTATEWRKLSRIILKPGEGPVEIEIRVKE